jgi:D-lactate dehydrogenase
MQVRDTSLSISRLRSDTVPLADGFPAVSVFVNDSVDADVLKNLAAGGTKLVATRSTGFNHIDLAAAKEFGVKVVRVADYSPNSVAEFAVDQEGQLSRSCARGTYSKLSNSKISAVTWCEVLARKD